MIKKLYLTRHGQTRFNELNRIQGASDSPLTDLGIEQAKRARKFFTGIKFDNVYCSTQERAIDTLEIITENKIPYTRLKGLKEFDFGVFEGQSDQLNPKVYNSEGFGDFFVQFKGESSVQVSERMDKTIKKIMNDPDNKVVLIVSHGGAIFNFSKLYFDAFSILDYGFRNLSTLVFNFDTDTQNFEYEKVLNLD